MSSGHLPQWAREVPVRTPAPAELQALRSALIASAHATPPARARRLPRVALAAAACAAVLAAGGLGWWGLRGARAPAMRATLEAAPGTQWVHTSTWLGGGSGQDEVVRLTEGRVHVSVHKLEPRERFRVVVGDGEVEVRGTAFEVVVHQDHLEAVHVEHGVVEVRHGGSSAAVLEAGEDWHPAPPAAPAPAAIAPAPEPESEAVAPPPAPPVAALPRPAPLRHAPAPIGAPAPVPPALAPVAPVAPPAAPPTPQEQTFAEGWSALTANRPGDAAPLLHQAWAQQPNAPLAEDARFWEGVALERSGQQAEAARVMRDFIDAFPHSARAGEMSAMLGWLLLREQRVTEACERFAAAAGDSNERARESATAGLAACRRAALPH
jgi:TolA-binding protein